MDVQRYRARWIIPVDGEPLDDGTIEIDANGVVAAIHDCAEPRAVDLGNVAILPGLVNAHTHLEFSALESPLAPGETFTDWIRAVVRNRRETASGGGVRRGLIESAQAGTTLLGEIATRDEPAELTETPGPRVVAFRELLGLRDDQIAPQLEIARRHLDWASGEEADAVIRGISPHAPYSVHPELFHKLVELAMERRAPLAIHLAETRAELELLERGMGAFVDLLREFGVWRDGVFAAGTRPLDYLRPLADIECGLIVHGNLLADEDLDFLASRPNLTVVYCPRTHAYLGHAAHRWREMLDRGVRVAIGTDSRASNPDLSLWRELCFLRERHPDVAPRTLLELGTIAGARGLGLDDATGSLRVGKRADLAVVELNSANGSDAWQHLFLASQEIVGTMCGGRWVHRIGCGDAAD